MIENYIKLHITEASTVHSLQSVYKDVALIKRFKRPKYAAIAY